MDLEIREALALTDDRTGALGQLLPGSEDHDYYRCLRAQQTGALDEADKILKTWPERHGRTGRYDTLRLRQLLYRVTRSGDVARAADETRDWFSVSHWHEAEVEEVDPTRPTRMPEGTFVGEAMLQQAIEYDSNLSQVSDEGLLELIARQLDPARRRVLLSRLHHTPQPEIVDHVAEELGTRGSSGWGALAIHEQLTLAQIHAVAQRRPELRGHAGWVGSVLRRMRPAPTVDLDVDREARANYLAQLWGFVAELPPAINSLKAHILWHILETSRRRGLAPDAALIRTYLALPRSAGYLSRKLAEHPRGDEVAQLGADYRNVTGLPPAGSDEELVRALVHDLVRDRPEVIDTIAPFLDRAWLETEQATAALLFGLRDGDRATLTLGPARAAALRERIELAWCPDNATQFAVGEPIVLHADAKNVGEVLVKVFRIDPLAYFQHHHREVNTDLDLDGLAASHEQSIKIPEPPVRRVRKAIELPMCSRAGTYVVDLIGNGMSSRTLVQKGRLRHVSRLGAAGHVVTIVDDQGAARPDARAWIGDREYVPDERGQFLVAFSTSGSRTPMLLHAGDVAAVAQLDLARETYQLTCNLVVDRNGLGPGRPARAIARLALAVAGAPVSLTALKRTSWEVTLTDRHGVGSTKSNPLALTDDGAAVLEWPMADDTASVAVTIRGTVEVRSEQREQELVASHAFQIGTMHAGNDIEALYLARTAAGHVVSALGKTGEPRAQRPVTVALTHRWARTQVNAELATDAQGRVELGHLAGIEWIAVTLGGHTQRWHADHAWLTSTVAGQSGREVLLPLPAGRSSAEVVRRMSLVELRAGVPARDAAADPNVAIESLEGALAIRGLPQGDYDLRAPGLRVTIAIGAPGAEVGGSVVSSGEVIERLPAVPAVASIERSSSGDVRVTVRGAGPRTRIHAIATRFCAAHVEGVPVGPRRIPSRRYDRVRAALYVSGRELGDEYRYVLERRSAKRHPNLMIDKPGLLLNPWSRRTTTTGTADARAGGHFQPSAAAPAPSAAYGGAARAEAQAADDAAFAAYDFLPDATPVLANEELDAAGVLVIPRGALGSATELTLIVDDPTGAAMRRFALDEAPLAPRDLRLRLALEHDRHAKQNKVVAPLRRGDRLVIADLATAKLHLIDTIEKAHAYLLALRDDASLREWSWITRWNALPDSERREKYSKYACHELHLFLYFKDRAFFDEVIRPYLAHKRTKTFLDHWLLEDDLAAWLEPAKLATLNAVERALLAHRLPPDDALPRVLGDQVAIVPPDPGNDTRIIDALIGAAGLDGDSNIAALQEAAVEQAESVVTRRSMIASGEGSGYGAAGPVAGGRGGRERADEAKRDNEGGKKDKGASRPMKKAKAAPMRARAAEKEMAEESDDYQADELLADIDARDQAVQLYRPVDKTQEWAEHNWWHRTPAESGAGMIMPNRLWRDLASAGTGSFLSGSLGLATSSFAEAMCALAVTDLPFVAAPHEIAADGPSLSITAAGNALAGSSQLVYGDLVPGGLPIVVGMSYVRADDRYDWSTGEQVEKYIEGALATAVVYTCQVVIANPTSSRQRVAALVQIPRGSLPVAGARPTHTLDLILEPYGTHGEEYSFYFPTPGGWSHFPVHVSRGGVTVAAAPGRVLEVTAGGAAPDPRSWAHVSQRGSVADVVAYLATSNLAAIDLSRTAWRLRDRAAYDAILGQLEKRRVYDVTLWGYALLHRDGPRIRTYLRSLGEQLLAAGPVLEMIGLDAEQLLGYEHLEYAPLVNARAHRLGPKLRILNDGLAQQYDKFLHLVAHRREPTSEDLLAAAAYFLAQDRADEASAALGRVRQSEIAEQLQHDYLAAYAACLAGDTGRAFALASRWREHPVDRWRNKFGALLAMLDEVRGTAPGPTVVDPRSREQAHAGLAARQPTFELAVDREGATVTSQHVASLELRYFEMDVELLFSRQPFVQSDVSRFSFIEPGHREQLADPPPEQRVPWPARLRGKNVVVEAVGAGQRKAKVHYANDLVTTVGSAVGQVRVTRASDRTSLPSTYVKVYARKRGGAVSFYKDGYTDLRGWFDYASLSTTDLDHVERFAILVCSDTAGASILEANPPAR